MTQVSLWLPLLKNCLLNKHASIGELLTTYTIIQYVPIFSLRSLPIPLLPVHYYWKNKLTSMVIYKGKHISRDYAITTTHHIL